MKKFLNANNETLITISEILTINTYETGTNKNPNYGLKFEFLNGESENVDYGDNKQGRDNDYITFANLTVE